MSTTLPYRKDIDGLRAVAVLPVVFYHGQIGGFTGGFVGVDIFFVISGFLISSILIREIDRGEFTLAGFYERRIRRIFPALFAMLGVTSLVASYFYTSHDFNELGKSLYSVVLFFSNFHFYDKQGYFDGDADLQLFLHTWSLAVEEQFYIFFPLLLLFLAKFGQKVTSIIIVTILLGSLIAAVIWVEEKQSVAFYFSWLRFWELLAGAVLALHILPKTNNRWFAEALAASGLVLMIAPMFIYTRESVFPGVLAIPVCLGSSMVIYSGSGVNTFVTRLLALPPLVFFGLISYSLYLWHWPIFVFSKYLYFKNTFWANALMVSLAVMLAWLSWRFVERPFRSRNSIGIKPLFRGAGLAAVTALLTAGLLDVTDGLPQRFDENVRQMLGDTSRHPRFRECGGIAPARLEARPECVLGSKEGKVSFALWGDSHAEVLAPALDKMASERQTRGWYFSKSACPPISYGEIIASKETQRELLRCKKYHAEILEYLENSEIEDIILAARWTHPPANLAEVRLAASLAPVLAQLQMRGKTVWVVNQVPEPGEDVARVMMRNLVFRGDKALEFALRENVTWQSDYRRQIMQLQSQYSFRILNPENLLCSNTCKMSDKKRLLYKDDNHLSVYGALKIAGLFAPVFQPIGAD